MVDDSNDCHDYCQLLAAFAAYMKLLACMSDVCKGNSMLTTTTGIVIEHHVAAAHMLEVMHCSIV